MDGKLIEAAQIALDVVAAFLRGIEVGPREVIIVLFDQATMEAYSNRLQNREN